MGAQLSEVRQLAGVQGGGELTGEFGLAAALVRQRKQIDHEPAGFPVRQPFAQAIEGSAIGIAREQPITVDEIEQRHLACAARNGSRAGNRRPGRACRWEAAAHAAG